MNGPWRLLVDGPGAPNWNMAVDRALLDCAVQKGSHSTLRLYWWEPHSLSLGAHQKGGDAVNWEALRSDGYGAVRRPTGGRAILHAQELTYSVITPTPEGGIVEAYRWLAAGLQGGLREAGVDIELERMSRPDSEPDARTGVKGQNGPSLNTRHPCFAAAGRYELVAGGRKVVGSAQCRSRGWLMQHGSILMGPGHLRLPFYLSGVDAAKEMSRLEEATVDCSSLLGREITAGDLVEPFATGFARSLGIELEEGEMSAQELDHAERLRAGQFGTEEWIKHGVKAASHPAPVEG